MTLNMTLIIIATVSATSIAQLLLKMGATNPGFVRALNGGLSDIVWAGILTPALWAGVLLYGLSAIAWIWVLSKVELTVAYPFVGLSFIFTLIIGLSFLDETASLAKISGTILIAVGCILVSRSA